MPHSNPRSGWTISNRLSAWPPKTDARHDASRRAQVAALSALLEERDELARYRAELRAETARLSNLIEEAEAGR